MTEVYQHKSVQNLAALYEEYKDQLGHGGGMMRIMWLAVKPSIPQMLYDLDRNPDLLVKAKPLLSKLLESLEEDINENADDRPDSGVGAAGYRQDDAGEVPGEPV